MSSAATLGLFLGGRATRMGGGPKGLLPAPDSGEPIVVRTRRLSAECGLACVAVGEPAAYADALRGVTWLRDAPAGIGPLGGLGALLAHEPAGAVIAVACDMPFLSAALLRRLANAPVEPSTDVLAARDAETGLWQPLFARYVSARVAPVLADALTAGERSFQALFRRLTVRELPLDAEEWRTLRDWDTPADVAGEPG